MTRLLTQTITIIILLLFSMTGAQAWSPASSLPEQEEDPGEALMDEGTQVASYFAENQGQLSDPNILFHYQSPGLDAAFLNGSYLLRKSSDDRGSSVVKLSFPGASNARPVSLGAVVHRSSYFRGNDPSNWQPEVPGFQEIVYPGLYPDIDLTFTVCPEGIKSEFRLMPGADPGAISVHYQGAQELLIDGKGSLVISTAAGEIVEEAPYSYQPLPGGRNREIVSSYQLEGSRLTFALGSHDPALPLVIDPLLYSGFLGGDKADHGYAMSVDGAGNIILAGDTRSLNFPTTAGAHDETGDEYGEVFVTALRAGGGWLNFSTFIGGSQSDIAKDLALDKEGNIYLTGATSSSDFPTTEGAFDREYNNNRDVFVCKLGPNGSTLLYSSFIGGGAQESGEGIAVDGVGEAFVTGSTTSSDFPTVDDSYDTDHNGGNDAFVLRVNHNGSQLLYSGFLGGGEEDEGSDLVLDAGSNAYVTGGTESSTFPVNSQSYDFTFNGQRDAFLCKLNRAGSSLRYSSFIGGENWDSGMSLDIDRHKNVYLAGTTDSPNFPTTAGAFDESHNGGYDAFVLRMNPSGEDLLFSTYLGGAGSEKYEAGIAIDSQGAVYVTGDTYSEDFPTTQGAHSEKSEGAGDAYLVKLGAEGDLLIYSSFIGGELDDGGRVVAVDPSGDAWVLGDTQSTDFPTVGQIYQNDHAGGVDLFLSRVNPGRPEAWIEAVTPNFLTEGGTVSFKGNGSDDGELRAFKWLSSIDGDLSTEQNFSSQELSNGSHLIYFSVMDDDGVWSSEDVAGLTVNGRPRIEELSAEPKFVNEGEAVELSAQVLDDVEVTRYLWTSSLDGVLGDGEEGAINTSSLSPGEHSITLKVQDNKLLWSQEHSLVLVVNARPVGSIISVWPNPALNTDSVLFQAAGVDEDEGLRFVWSSSLEGELYNGTKDNFSYARLSQGRHQLTLSVQDQHGLWGKEISTVLDIHSRPTAKISRLSPNPAQIGKEVSFRAEGSDDGWIVLYRWESSVDGLLYNGTRSSFSADDLSAAQHQISLIVQDQQGAWSEPVVETLVVEDPVAENQRPTISISNPSNGSRVSGLVRIEGSAADSDGSVSKVEFSVDNSSWLLADGVDSWGFNWNSEGEEPGNHEIRVRCFDGLGYSEEAVLELEVKEEGEGEGNGELDLFWPVLLGIVVLVAVLGLYLARDQLYLLQAGWGAGAAVKGDMVKLPPEPSTQTIKKRCPSCGASIQALVNAAGGFSQKSQQRNKGSKELDDAGGFSERSKQRSTGPKGLDDGEAQLVKCPGCGKSFRFSRKK